MRHIFTKNIPTKLHRLLNVAGAHLAITSLSLHPLLLYNTQLRLIRHRKRAHHGNNHRLQDPLSQMWNGKNMIISLPLSTCCVQSVRISSNSHINSTVMIKTMHRRNNISEARVRPAHNFLFLRFLKFRVNRLLMSPWEEPPQFFKVLNGWVQIVPRLGHQKTSTFRRWRESPLSNNIVVLLLRHQQTTSMPRSNISTHDNHHPTLLPKTPKDTIHLSLVQIIPYP